MMQSTLSHSKCPQFSLESFIEKKYTETLLQNTQRIRSFDQCKTLYCFIYQVIHGCSMKSALINLNAKLLELDKKVVSLNTAAYSKAKNKLCTIFLKKIATESGENLMNASTKYQYKNKDVIAADGTNLNLEDTEDNREKFVPAIRQGRQSGWPKLRMLALFDASSGGFLDAELGSFCGKKQGEISLLKNLLDRVKKDSILLLDRLFTNVNLRDQIVLSLKNYVIRARDEKAKKILKRKCDTVITEKSSVGRILKTRYLRSTFKRDGFRDTEIYLVTNLLKEDGHKKSDIEKLYQLRWSIELDFRNLKQSLNAKKLRSKSSEMVKKELWVHMIAYNMIRKITLAMSLKNKKKPRQQSFKIGKEIYEIFLTGRISNKFEELIELFKNEFLNSKYRYEPRLIRFHLKKYETMKLTRDQQKKQAKGKLADSHQQAVSNKKVA